MCKGINLSEKFSVVTVAAIGTDSTGFQMYLTVKSFSVERKKFRKFMFKKPQTVKVSTY